MSVGRVDADEEFADQHAEFADALADGEEVRLSWSATEVHWADEWRSVPDEATFAATDRRVLFVAGDSTTSIGYDHVRAVITDSATGGPDLSTAFVACGGLCLLVGLLVATSDLLNGVGLVVLSMALLAAGSTVGDSSDGVTVTIVIDNERQRLSFSAAESVGVELATLADEF